MKSSAMFVSLLITGESLTLTGRDDQSTSVPFCYSGFDLRETVDVKMDSITNETETVDVTGGGLGSIPCLGKSLTKNGQDLTVNLIECVSDVQISSLQHCLDQDEIYATMIKSFIRVDVQLSSSSRSSVGVTMRTER